MIRKIILNLKRFRSSDEGSLSVEMILMVPLLLWAVMATIVFFDGFRSQFQVQKSTATIADYVSRAEEIIYPNEVDGMFDLYEILTPDVSDRGLRVSEFQYQQSTNDYDVLWSASRGTISGPLEGSDLTSVAAQMPLMSDAEKYIIVETTAEYNNSMVTIAGPILTGIGLGDRIAIAPRFASQVCYSSTDNPLDKIC